MVVLPHPVRARRVGWRECISWRRVVKRSVVLNLGEPFLYLVAVGFALFAYVNLGRGQTYAAFVAPALIAVTAMNAVTFDSLFGSWNNMHDKRVFEAIVTAPITPQDLVLGEFFWQASRALLYGMTFALVMFAVGLFRSPWALALPLVLVLMGPRPRRPDQTHREHHQGKGHPVEQRPRRLPEEFAEHQVLRGDGRGHDRLKDPL